jgi:hypothetical protein
MRKIDIKNLDKKTKIEVIITIAAVVIFIVILTNSIISIFRKTRRPAPVIISSGTYKEMLKRQSKDTKPLMHHDKEKYLTDRPEDAIVWGRDPFSTRKALIGEDFVISNIKLEGVLWDDGTAPRAIINGQMVAEGDDIAGVSIVDIQKDPVTVTDGSKNYKLHLW